MPWDVERLYGDEWEAVEQYLEAMRPPDDPDDDPGLGLPPPNRR